MSQFIVSARKYRPTRFDEVVGQAHVSKTLKNAIQNDHLAHAFLFCGPRGVGKTTCARILAKVLNCQNRTPDHEACNECSSCKSFNHNASFNITELDAASNNSVEHIRALIEQVRFQPQQGAYKVFIIDEVHMLSAQAFNAFLKTLEEPPAYAVFILATTEKHKIIPTILSRCQIFDFRRIQVADMVAHLQQIGSQENIAAEETALHIIAQKADGALRDALSIFDRIVSGLPPEGKDKKTLTYKSVIESLNVLDYDYYFKVLDALLAEDRAQVMLLFDKIQRNGFEADTFILGLAEHIRNVLVCKDEQTLALLEMSEDLKKRYEAQANLCSPDFLLSLLNIANNCDVHYKMARNKRLHVEMALLKMTYVNRAINTSYTPATDTPKTPPNTQKKNTEISSPLSNNNNPANTYTTPPPPVEQLKEPSPTPPKKEVKQSTPMQQKEPIAKLADSKLPEELRHKAIRQIPKLDSLDALDKEIENEAPLVQLQLNIETLQEVWTAYTKQIDSPTTRMTFQQVKLAVEDNTIQASVPSSMSKSMIIAESQLLPFLRSHLKNNRLVLEIKIDASLAPASQEKEKAPKAFSLKEKYHAMRKVNPLVDDLVERFGLKPE